jgi:hypothetical protein
VKGRLEGICAAYSLALEHLPLFVITTPLVRLDIEHERARLKDTIERVKPGLLILDPFIRMHAIDENASSQVATVLGHLRYLQRTYSLAIAVVHHARKGTGLTRPGQALRGSSEFHAWGDSNLYLKRNSHDELSLTVEHRAAPPLGPLGLSLEITSPNGPHLQFHASAVPSDTRQKEDPETQILALLKAATSPLKTTDIRCSLPLRNSTISQVLDRLSQQGVILKTALGYTPHS